MGLAGQGPTFPPSQRDSRVQPQPDHHGGEAGPKPGHGLGQGQNQGQ